jgi:hypothetical protein
LKDELWRMTRKHVSQHLLVNCMELAKRFGTSSIMMTPCDEFRLDRIRVAIAKAEAAQ